MHATFQHTGGRHRQCDATATYTHNGVRAHVLLDGIGDTDTVRTWARSCARRIARSAATRRSAEYGLRTEHQLLAIERTALGWRADDEPSAVAVVALTIPGEPLRLAWCGDSRAYVLERRDFTDLERLTTDHNMRQVLLDMNVTPGPASRHTVTSYLGDTTRNPKISTATGPATGRLLLLSDGAYEPLEDAGQTISAHPVVTPATAARRIVTAAITHAVGRADNATALVADFG